MNAIELSNEFDVDNNQWNEDNIRHWGKEASTMLRQQQAKIEGLKECIRQYEIEFNLRKAKWK